jgi:hypothetical protein
METIEFHLNGLPPELETKLRDMVSAGKKPEEAAFEINKAILADFMRENKIDLVVADYEGSGDGGGVGYVAFFREGHQVDVPQGRTQLVIDDRLLYQKNVKFRIRTVEVEARDAFSLPVDSALNLFVREGWDVGDGGYGEVRFTLKSPQDETVAVKITHNAYITEVETNEYDI